MPTPARRCGRSCARRSGREITVDLERQVAIDVEGREHAFSIHPLRRRCLLNGLDDISLTAEFLDVIQPFETGYRQEFSWLEAADKP